MWLQLVDLDCDLYSSTMDALSWLMRHRLLVPTTIVRYDDWGNTAAAGSPQAAAHAHASKRWGLEWRPLGGTRSGRAFQLLSLTPQKKQRQRDVEVRETTRVEPAVKLAVEPATGPKAAGAKSEFADAVPPEEWPISLLRTIMEEADLMKGTKKEMVARLRRLLVIK